MKNFLLGLLVGTSWRTTTFIVSLVILAILAIPLAAIEFITGLIEAFKP